MSMSWQMASLLLFGGSTGIPTNNKTVEPPRSSNEAICQDMLMLRLR